MGEEQVDYQQAVKVPTQIAPQQDHQAHWERTEHHTMQTVEVLAQVVEVPTEAREVQVTKVT